MKRILFIAHSTSVSGASLVLLNFAKWLKANHANINMDILIPDKGEDVDEYEKIFNRQYYIRAVNNHFAYRAYKSVRRRLGMTDEKVLFKNILQNHYDVIYCNTVLTLYWGIALKRQSASKLVAHIHELNTVIKSRASNLDSFVAGVDKFICASQAVADNLMQCYKIEKAKLSVVYEFIDIAVSQPHNSMKSTGFIVGSSGFLDWRKGYDIFLLIANGFKKKYPDVNVLFRWFGSAFPDTKIIIEEDLRKMNLNDIVEFPGLTMNPMDEYSRFDIFLLTSREDPFPLVCIEAGSLGKPIICFEDAGGACELIAKGGGIRVPYLDVDFAIEAISMYVRDEQKRNTDSEYIRQRTQEFSTENKAPEIYKIIKRLVA